MGRKEKEWKYKFGGAEHFPVTTMVVACLHEPNGLWTTMVTQLHRIESYGHWTKFNTGVFFLEATKSN